MKVLVWIVVIGFVGYAILGAGLVGYVAHVAMIAINGLHVILVPFGG